MKLIKLFIMFFILTISFIECEKSTLKITNPDDNFFLHKLKNIGNDFKISHGGEKITTEKGNYTFEKKITGIAGIYKKDGSDEYMFVLPAGNEAHTVSVNEKEKKALEDIINIVGEENSGSVIQEILSNDEKLNADKIAGSNFSQEKKDAIQNVIDNLYSDGSKNNFGSYKKYE